MWGLAQVIPVGNLWVIQTQPIGYSNPNIPLTKEVQGSLWNTSVNINMHMSTDTSIRLVLMFFGSSKPLIVIVFFYSQSFKWNGNSLQHATGKSCDKSSFPWRLHIILVFRYLTEKVTCYSIFKLFLLYLSVQQSTLSPNIQTPTKKLWTKRKKKKEGRGLLNVYNKSYRCTGKGPGLRSI